MGRQRNFVHNGPGERGKQGLPVNMLREKFCGWAVYLGCNHSVAGLEKALGIPEETLNTAIHAGGCTTDLMDRLEDAMRGRYGKIFSQSWKEWRDPDEDPKKRPQERSDAAEKFLEKLRTENSSARPNRNDDTGRPGLPVAIDVGPRHEPVHRIAVDLASVAIEGSQPGFGTVAIEVTVACGVWQDSMIQSGRIDLGLTPAKMTPASYSGWLGRTKTIKTTRPDGKEGSVLLAFGGTWAAPYWRVTAVRGGIGTFFVDPAFAALEGLAPGCKVTVKFGTWLSEVEDTDETGGGDGFILVDEKGRQLDIPQAELSKKKRRVMANIRKAILDAGPDGYVDLASHTLIVVEKK